MSTKNDDTTTSESIDTQTNTTTTTEELRGYLDLHAFARDTLRAIHVVTQRGDEPYGLEVKRQLESWYDTEVNHGRLYPNLDTLVQKGLVEKSALDRRTNEYALTTEGRTMVEAVCGHYSGIGNGGGE